MTRITLPFVLVLMVFLSKIPINCLAGTAQDVKDSFLANEYERKGFKSAEKKEFEQAVKYFTKAIELGSDEASTWSNRGTVYYKLKKYDEAINDYSEAIRRGLVNRVYGNRAYAHMRKHALDLVIKDVTAALEHGDPQEIILLRGDAHWRLNNIDAARLDLDKAVEVDPKNPDCYRIRGTMRLNSLKDYLGAIEDYDRVAQLDPKEMDAYLLKAVAYKELGKDDLSQKEIRRALAIDPNEPRAFLQRGEYALRNGNWQAAHADFETALRFEKEHGLPYGSTSLEHNILRGQLWYFQGKTYEEEMKHEHAKSCFDRAVKEMTNAIQLQPHHLTSYQYRCLALRCLGRDNDAQADERKIEELGTKFKAGKGVVGR